jgi:DNA primase catalytic core
MIPDSVVDRIKDLPIFDVLKDHIELKKKGSNFVGCCPFHNEKTPSLTVFPKKNNFKCYGCNEQGGAVSFIMKLKNLTYPEALELIGKEHMIDIPHKELTPKEQIIVDQKALIRTAIEFAKSYFVESINHPENIKALEYALTRWSKETIEKFQIGFAPDSWHDLLNLAKQSGITEKTLMDASLISEKSTKPGEYFNFFKNRLMIPLLDARGRTVGFTGRTIKDETPKYFNSRGSELYKKGNLLFGLNLATQGIKYHDHAYLVEGNADVIKLHQLNVPNAVGSCGTAFTRDQCLLLQANCSSVTIIPDNDQAGIAAADITAKLILSEGMSCNILYLPKGDPILNDAKETTGYSKVDADSFFKNTAHFEAYSKANSQDFIIAKTNRWAELPKTPNNSKRAIDEVSSMIYQMGPDSQELYIDIVSKIIKTKKAWTDRLSQLKKDDAPEIIYEKPGDKIPENVSLVDWEKYGFYASHNCYYFKTQRGIERGCNFTLEPLFHIESVTDAKRIFRITNEFNVSRVIELPQEAIISLGKFKVAVESLGNFLWEMGDVELNKLKRYLYQETRSALIINQLGWHKNGFYSWSNGIYNGSFTKIDDEGIVSHDEVYYYLPAHSSIWAKEFNHYVSERQFIHRTDNTISLREYSSKLITVFGENASVALCFYFASLFRDILFKRFNFFPILNLFGPKGAGKTELAVSLMSFFGKLGKGPNINSTTKAALADHVSQLCNACAHIDEYSNSIELDKIEFLKGLWDGVGRTRMAMDKDKKKETTLVECAVILSGQEMPTADIALFSRLIYLTFSKVEYDEQAKQDFNELKAIESKGNTHITNEILALRKLFQANFADSYTQTAEDFNIALQDSVIEDRIFKNWLLPIATFHAIRSAIDISFTYEQLIAIAAVQIRIQNGETKQSNEVSTFWEIVKYLASDGLIHDNVDYKIQKATSIKTDEMTSAKEFEDTTAILYIQMSRIKHLYRKQGRQMGMKVMPLESMDYYLKHDKRYLGKKRARFNFLDTTLSIEGQWSNRPEWAYCFEYKPLGIDLSSDKITERLEDDAVEIPNSERRPAPAIPFGHKQKTIYDSSESQ